MWPGGTLGSVVQLNLGPFALKKPIGKGGMGEVWLAEHRTQRVPIAVKVDLHPPEEAYSAAFLHEVEAVAALDHRNVVLVLEHGVVDEAAQIAAKGAMREGARWLAMELALGGSVGERPPQNWREVLHVARGTLDALAHSHARGVIHRDLKPANLLLAGSEVGVSTRPSSLLDARIVLSDFGISERRATPSTNTEEAVGTPHFMAPEQIEALWRDQGPWTDLYAMGVLLWRLVTGSYPHDGKGAFQIYRSHLMSPPRRFEAQMPVPDGLEAVLRRCLEKDFRARYPYAIHLLKALEELGGADGGDDGQLAAVADEETVRTLDATLTPAPTRSTGGTRRRNARVPEGTRARNFQLQGAGLSLFGMRTPPLVGREALCESLWAKLVEVRAAREARIVVLRGAMGSGKSRLASWLAERAHELGVCDAFHATNQAGQLPGEALVRMLRGALRTDGLDADELDARLEREFPDAAFDRRALLGLLAPQSTERPPPTRREARVLLLAALSHLAQRGSVLLHLEDAHLDPEALELVDHLIALQGMRPSPILVVVTVRDDALIDRPEIAELLADLLEDPAVTQLEVPPLSPDAQAKLVRTLVGLEGAIAQRLEERTAGNPMFAVQLIRAWIEQGVLLPGPDGFRLRPGAEALLPNDLVAVWESRVDALLAGRSGDDVLAIEAAAAIGLQVRHQAWTETFELLEIEPSSGLFQELLRRHLVSLVDESGDEWRFVHALLREVLESRARAEDSWYDVNLAAAIQLKQSGVRAPRRLAQYLLEAEVWDQAADPLSAAIADTVDSGDVRDDTLIRRLQEVLDRLELPPSDPWWGRLGLIRAGRARLRRELDEAERLALEVVRSAETYGWEDEHAMGLREASRVMFANTSLERALDYATRAEALFDELGDGMRATDTAYTVGLILSRKGDFAGARAKFLGCVEAIERNGWKQLLHDPLLGLAFLEQRAGNLDEAVGWLHRCRDHAEPLGLSTILANCANVEGEIARGRGELEHAAACYRESADRYQAMESPSYVYPALNIGILDVVAQRYAAAVERMRLLLTYLRRTPQPALEAYANVILFAAEAGSGNFDPAVDSLIKVTNYLSASSVADADIALMTETGGVLLGAAGYDRDARRALNLAITQYRALNREADAERLARRL